MKRLPVHWSRSGREDVNAIIDHIEMASGSTRIALHYLNRLEARCQRIGDAPRSGRARDDLAPGLRSVSFEGSALICYTIDDNRVWITNVFRRGRNIDAFFSRKTATRGED